MLYRYSALHSKILFLAVAWIDGGVETGAIRFGIEDIDDSEISISVESISPTIVIGEITLAGLGLVDGDLYNLYAYLDATSNATITGNAHVQQIHISIELDIEENGSGFPAANTDNAIARFDGVDSQTLQGSLGLIDDAGILTAETVKSNGNICVNANGVDGDSYLYFYAASSETGSYLMWDDINIQFYFNHSIKANNIRAIGNYYVRFDGADGDSYIYFYENGSVLGAYFMWDDSETGFALSHTLVVSGDIVGTNLKANTNIYVNADGADANSYLYFYDGGSATGQYLEWDNTNNYFVLSQSLEVVRTVDYVHNLEAYNLSTGTSAFTQVNARVAAIGCAFGQVGINAVNWPSYGGAGCSFIYSSASALGLNIVSSKATGTSGITFYVGGNASGTYKMRIDTAGLVDITGTLNAGIVRSNGNININYDGADGDSYLYFYEASSNTGASLMFDDSEAGFVLSHKIDITGLIQCDSFRIDQAPATETITPDKTITINVNGANYKIAVVAV